MGLPRGLVWVEDYNDEWPRLFEEERVRILEVVGNIVISIQHVGSTAVPGLCAKPVVDIAVGVKDLETGRGCVDLLTGGGYEFKGDAGIPGRYFFAKGTPDNRTHYIHVEAVNGLLWRNHILFRDYLRSHPDVVAAYGELKKILATKHGDDREKYALGKKPFIDEIISKASEEYELNEMGETRVWGTDPCFSAPRSRMARA